MRLWWQVPRVLAIIPPAYHEVGQRRCLGVEGLLDVETAVTPRFALMGCPPAWGRNLYPANLMVEKKGFNCCR